MNDLLTRRLSAAVRAAWWTVLVWAAFLTVGWLFWLVILTIRPGWLLTLWGGGDLAWPQVHLIVLCFFGLLKLALLFCVMGSLCLTFWLRTLRQAGQAEG